MTSNTSLDRSPTPLSQWQTKPEAVVIGKGKKPIYPNRSWVRPRQSDLRSMYSPNVSFGQPTLSTPIPAGSGRDTDGAEARDGYGHRKDTVGKTEGEVSQVAGENTQDNSPVLSVNAGVRVKTEELPDTIPSPTHSNHLVRRKRSSRSTIDVFGEPTGVSVEVHDSVPTVTKEEHVSMSRESDTVIDVDAFLATALPPRKDEPSFVNECPMSVSWSTSSLAVPPSRCSPPPSGGILDRCRAILISLVEQNARLREPGVDLEVVKKRAYTLLSDKLCADFVKLAKQVREQMAGPDATHLHPAKRMRDSGHDMLDSPPKRPKLELPKGAVVDGACVASPALLNVAAPMDEDVRMDGDTETLSPGDHSECLAYATGLPLKLQVDSHSTHDLARNTSASSPDMPIAGNHSPTTTPAQGSRSPTTTPAHDAPEEPSLKMTSGFPSDIQSTNNYPLLPSRQTTPVSVRGDIHEADHAQSDSSRHDAETVMRLLDLTSEDEDERAQKSGDMLSGESPASLKSNDDPPCLVPGIWGIVKGQPSARIESMKFSLDNATVNAVQQWSMRHEFMSLNDHHVALHLLCLPITAADAVLQNPALSPEEIAAALFDIPSEWPELGTLVVTLNSVGNPPTGSTWFTHRPMLWTTHLDVAQSIQLGTNTIDLIHLAPLADRLFVLHAAEPSEDARMAAYKQTMTWLTIKRNWGLDDSHDVKCSSALLQAGTPTTETVPTT